MILKDLLGQNELICHVILSCASLVSPVLIGEIKVQVPINERTNTVDAKLKFKYILTTYQPIVVQHRIIPKYVKLASGISFPASSD